MSQRLIDLSYPLDDNTPFYAGLPAAEITVHASIPAEHPPGTPGAGNMSSLKTNLHVGTHMDAPFHFYRRGPTIDQIDLRRCMGPALLIDLTYKQANEPITAEELQPYAEAMRTTNKVILRTGWARYWGEPSYFNDHPDISPGAARFLVAAGVDLVGVDTPSVDKPPFATHFVLLGANLLIVENLANLDQIGRDYFHFTALPLKISGRDASPVRVIALVENG